MIDGRTNVGMRTMRDEMNQDALRWFAFRRWMQRAKRSIAIEKIKAQPFYGPRYSFRMGNQWPYKDEAGAICCDGCHSLIDGRTNVGMDRLQRQGMHEQANRRTMAWWRKKGYLA